MSQPGALEVARREPQEHARPPRVRALALQRRAEHLLDEVAAVRSAARCYSAGVRCCVALLALLVACGKARAERRDGRRAARTARPRRHAARRDAWTCEPLPFEASTPLPEASGAAWLDSTASSRSSSSATAATTARTPSSIPRPARRSSRASCRSATARRERRHRGPRDARRQARRHHLVGLDPRVAAQRQGLRRSSQGPYPLGPVDLPDKGGLGDKPPKGDGMVCADPGHELRPQLRGPLPRRDGTPAQPLRRLRRVEGRRPPLLPDASRTTASSSSHRDGAIEVGRPGTLADCAFDDDGTLWVGNNLFGLANVYASTLGRPGARRSRDRRARGRLSRGDRRRTATASTGCPTPAARRA